jgi:hypothetical protein
MSAVRSTLPVSSLARLRDHSSGSSSADLRSACGLPAVYRRLRFAGVGEPMGSVRAAGPYSSGLSGSAWLVAGLSGCA